MFVNSLLTVLTAGLAFEVAASPLAHDGTVTRREIPATHVLHERHAPRLANKWTKRAKVPAGAVLPVRIGLKQSNLDAGHNKLMDMYENMTP
jgi:tripeptidyl-peptidase I